jgi:hypothetical protein
LEICAPGQLDLSIAVRTREIGDAIELERRQPGETDMQPHDQTIARLHRRPEPRAEAASLNVDWLDLHA